MLQESSTDVALLFLYVAQWMLHVHHVAKSQVPMLHYYFFMLRNGCCMEHDVNIAVGIFHP